MYVKINYVLKIIIFETLCYVNVAMHSWGVKAIEDRPPITLYYIQYVVPPSRTIYSHNVTTQCHMYVNFSCQKQLIDLLFYLVTYISWEVIYIE